MKVIGDYMKQARDTLNQILVHLFNDILKVEEKSLAKGPYSELTMTDMHTIETIGFNQERNMTSIAKDLTITVGTLTIAINHLVKKGYVERKRSSKDRRVVLVSLTNKGKAAFRHHLTFHDRMVEQIMEQLEDNELKVLVGALQKIDGFFSEEKKKLLEKIAYDKVNK
jgi:DNA-binding MarR family transcriptional regulator